ncbi:hypothetical protein CEV31_0822 [Brucella thiophenivorans]|uniref:Uncharacterized protein n=1 Tax=Brucella thiophenivorans TaxID=571255 RepID=A0A256G3H0_9HYPH|nr:hypothetical protein CEV31_0822 [Brucella thiophenivorans]
MPFVSPLELILPRREFAILYTECHVAMRLKAFKAALRL